MNPRSRFDSPPHEYTALHQHGNLVGRGGAAGAILLTNGFKQRLDKAQSWRFGLEQFETKRNEDLSDCRYRHIKHDFVGQGLTTKNTICEAPKRTSLRMADMVVQR